MGDGLRRVCKLTGGMTVVSGGEKVEYVWDYASDEPVNKSEMPFGSERHKRSERVRWGRLADSAEAQRLANKGEG